MEKWEKISGYFLLAYSTGLVYQSLHLSIGSPGQPGPGFLGFFLGLGLFLLSGSLIIMNWKWRHIEGKPQRFFFEHRRAWFKPLFALILLISFATFMEILGTIGALFLFFFLWIRVLGKKGWVLTALVGGTGTTCFYFLFSKLLGISLPKGLFLG